MSCEFWILQERANMQRLTVLISFFVFLIFISSPFLAWSDDEVFFEKALSYTVEINSQVKTPFKGDGQGIYAGAGFLIDKKRGWIITNAHVTSYSPSQVSVSFKDEDFVSSETVYVDPYLDLAIIKFPPEKISDDKREADLKCDGDVKIGHPVGAFGHPWDFSYTGTKGIISGKTSHFGNQLLQTDAPINSGNSGGPLISLKTGEVLAINTSSYDDDDDQNTNFAEQIKFVCRVLELLKQEKDPSPVKLPVSFLVDPFKGATMIVSNLYMENNLIDLKVDDQIVRVVDYDPIKTEGELIHALRGRSNDFTLEVLRNNVSKVISGKLEKYDPIIRRKGIIVSGMLISDYWIRDKPILDLPEFSVHFVQPGSLAEGELIEADVYLESINGNTFKTFQKLYSYLKKNEGQEIKMRLATSSGADDNYYLTHYEHTLPVRDVRFIGETPGG
jgi:serine protease Do